MGLIGFGLVVVFGVVVALFCPWHSKGALIALSLALGQELGIICIVFMFGYSLLVIEEEDPATSAMKTNLGSRRHTEH